MSKKRQKEIIGWLENTINSESLKINGGNKELVESLKIKLEKVKNWEENNGK